MEEARKVEGPCHLHGEDATFQSLPEFVPWLPQVASVTVFSGLWGARLPATAPCRHCPRHIAMYCPIIHATLNLSCRTAKEDTFTSSLSVSRNRLSPPPSYSSACRGENQTLRFSRVGGARSQSGIWIRVGMYKYVFRVMLLMEARGICLVRGRVWSPSGRSKAKRRMGLTLGAAGVSVGGEDGGRGRGLTVRERRASPNRLGRAGPHWLRE